MLSPMTKQRCYVLLAGAAWMLYVWITRLVIMLPGDESVGFKVVHSVLAAVSIGFALAFARIGWSGLTSLRSRAT